MASAITTTGIQAETRQLFNAFWTNSQRDGGKTMPPEVAIAASLAHLAETLERNMTAAAAKTYLAVLADLTQEELVLKLINHLSSRSSQPSCTARKLIW
jgi:hypothetical protein